MIGKTTFFIAFTCLVSSVTGIAVQKNLRENCGALRRCFLLNIDSGKKFVLTGRRAGEYALDSNLDRHTIVCETRGSINKVTYTWEEESHTEYARPWTMMGDDRELKTINDVPYLAVEGKKEISVVGETWTDKCFKKTISFEVGQKEKMMKEIGDRRELDTYIIITDGETIIIIRIR